MDNKEYNKQDFRGLTEEAPAEQAPKKTKLSFLRVGKMIAVILFTVGVLVGAGFLIMSRPVKIAWANLVLDNREHYSDCYSLPFYPQVEKTLKDHGDVVEKLKLLGAFDIFAQRITCKGWDNGMVFIKGDIIIQYDTHAQRLAIEKLIGDNFFGIPYRGKSY